MHTEYDHLASERAYGHDTVLTHLIRANDLVLVNSFKLDGRRFTNVIHVLVGDLERFDLRRRLSDVTSRIR